MDGDIRKPAGPHALLAQREAEARRAGREAHGEALAAYVAQFGGRRPGYAERECAEPMQSSVDAADRWFDRMDHVCAPERVQLVLWRAFLAGWQDAEDAL